ncbi:hypothetical protein Tco_0679323 [Tanacetum coccineum]|uniref:Uncharacterized protein n=1 Tax=Tanacetum coccineum TaxID=301880 RepID=A0ABQ4XHJ1_9ASTR
MMTCLQYLGALISTLYRDRPHHRRTALAMDREAIYARIAWTSSEERSAAIEAHVKTLEAHVATLITQTTSLQTQLATALGRIATLEARDLKPQDEPAKTGSSCVAAALAERNASRSRDGDNSHGSGTGGRRQVPTQRECTYTNFLKCQPINFKGMMGCRTNVAYAMPMEAFLKRMLTDKYCPMGEDQKVDLSIGIKGERLLDLMTYNSTIPRVGHSCAIECSLRNKLNVRKIRNLMKGNQNLYKPGAIITTMGHVLKSALTAKRLVTRPVTVKFDLLLTTTTTTTITRGPKGQIHELSLALSVECQASLQVCCPKAVKMEIKGIRLGYGNAVARVM